jgi:hypothetical protein
MLWPYFTPGERTPSTLGQEAGWAPEPVRTQEARGNIHCLCLGSSPDHVIQSIVRHYTDRATPAHATLTSNHINAVTYVMSQ